jgi:hypothetical protein
MDIRNFIRPIIAGLIGIGLIVLVIVLISKAFSGGGTPLRQVDLGKYASTAATTTLLVDAPTIIDQDHRQVKITVSQTTNEIDIIQGYQGIIINTQSYPNNSAAYGAFLQSLKLLNFTKGNTDKNATDYRGYCPTGERYVYTFNDGNTDLSDFWSTSCRQGTFKGNALGVLNLFRAQIPRKDFDRLTSGIPLGF